MRTVAVWFAAALWVGGCSEDPLDLIPPTGKVDGYLCDPNSDFLAVGATVKGPGIAGGLVTAITDHTGFFTLRDVAAGNQTLTVTGASQSFTVTISVTVIEAEITRLPEPPCLNPPSGAVQGRVCAVESEIGGGIGSGEGYWLTHARVWIRVDGQDYETVTDHTGFFRLEAVPSGNRTLFVQKGSFTGSQQVTIRPEKTEELDHVCLDPTIPLMVVTGEFDSIHEVLKDLGYKLHWCETAALDSACPTGVDDEGNISLYDGEDPAGTYITTIMENAAELDQYKIVFFNCGLGPQILNARPEVKTNLRNFVEQGGSIYVSDWAFRIITDLFAAPPATDPELDFLDNEPSVGMQMSLTAQVTDEALKGVVGATVNVKFNQASWVVLEPEQLAGVHVMMRGDVDVDYDKDLTPDATLATAPLLVSLPFGEGRILFTTFHHDAQTSSELQEVLRYLVFEL